MYLELDDYYGGIVRFLIRKWSQFYIAIGMCILFLYLIDHWMFKELTIGLVIMPIIVPIVGFPLVWYLDIRPKTKIKGE